jgi:hypothetical protein
MAGIAVASGSGSSHLSSQKKVARFCYCCNMCSSMLSAYLGILIAALSVLKSKTQ